MFAVQVASVVSNFIHFFILCLFVSLFGTIASVVVGFLGFLHPGRRRLLGHCIAGTSRQPYIQFRGDKHRLFGNYLSHTVLFYNNVSSLSFAAPPVPISYR